MLCCVRIIPLHFSVGQETLEGKRLLLIHFCLEKALQHGMVYDTYFRMVITYINNNNITLCVDYTEYLI